MSSLFRGGCRNTLSGRAWLFCRLPSTATDRWWPPPSGGGPGMSARLASGRLSMTARRRTPRGPPTSVDGYLLGLPPGFW